MDKPCISHLSVRYCQNGNTLGTTEEVEALEVSLEWQLMEEDGPFVVIRTEGWSFDNMEELQEVVERTVNMPKHRQKQEKKDE